MNWRNTIFFLFFTLVCCDPNEAVDPVVSTNDATQLGTTTAVVEGNILEPGSVRPIRYGFLWDSVGGLNILKAKNKLDLDSTFTKNVFSIVLSNLKPGTKYYVRAYAASVDYARIYYGNEVTFKTLP